MGSKVINAFLAGLCCFALANAADADIVPMYQVYSPSQTDFFYTTNWTERSNAIAYYGYLDRGISYYIDDGLVRDAGTAFWQRFYKGLPQREHFYTWTQADMNYVLANGWVYEAADGVVKTAAGTSGTVPLYRYYRFDSGTYDLQHYYTTNWQDSLQPWMAGWGSDGIVAFVWTAPQAWDWAARFVSQTVPAVMEANVVYPVTITMRNVGHKTWRVHDNIFLQAAAVTPYWCVQDQTYNGAPLYYRANVTYDVAPGQDAVFNFSVKPGGCLGSQSGFQWRMVGDNVSFRSEDTPLINVQVVPPSAVFVGQSVAAGQLAGKPYRVQITMRNASASEKWTSGAGYVLAAIPENGTWGANRITVPTTVLPGQSVTFDFNVTAPPTGTYNFQWRMAQGPRSFGQITPLVRVVTTGSPSDYLPSRPPPSVAPPYPALTQYPPY